MDVSGESWTRAADLLDRQYLAGKETRMLRGPADVVHVVMLGRELARLGLAHVLRTPAELFHYTKVDGAICESPALPVCIARATPAHRLSCPRTSKIHPCTSLMAPLHIGNPPLHIACATPVHRWRCPGHRSSHPWISPGHPCKSNFTLKLVR